MKNKVIKGILFGILGLVGLATTVFVGLFLYFWFADDPADPNTLANNNLGIPNISNVVVADADTVIYESEDLKLVIEASEENTLPVAGNTRDGSEWKTDGTNIFVDNKKITVEKNTQDKDQGKIAAVGSALSARKGYTKGVDDYNHNYAVYYVEAANCMLYYPKQLTLVKENEDQSLLFRDSRSNAELKVILDKNEFASMDEVESLIANSTYSKVLASGTDWFSAENYGKTTTSFCLTGLGNKYAVSAELTYENKYNFVFEELRKLIKCQFIEDGVWVSNATVSTVGEAVAAIAEEAYDPVLKRTSYHSEKLNCVIAYPDIFTKCYTSDGAEFFTDPKTGAYIELTRVQTDITIGEFQEALQVEESNLVSDHALRASNNNEIMFAAVRDGYMWTAIMTYDAEYSDIYSDAYDMLEICLEGDDVNNTEMKQIYFPSFNCYVVIPVQYEEYGMDGDVHLLKDTITGLEARLSFTEISNPSDYDNLYSVFHVVAEDGNVLLCEDMVKWHNMDGLFLGAAGREYAALLELSYPNAYSTYEKCWTDFGIYFFTGEELETDAEQIREEAMASVVLAVAKEEVIKEDDDEADLYAKADTNAPKIESNIAESLMNAGKKPGATGDASSNLEQEPNRVLVYKTLNDYMDVVTSGDEWLNVFPDIFPRPADTRQARYYVVLFSMNVLAYNGYTLPDYASDAYAVADVVDEYVRALMDSGERIDTQLGEGEISVFEVLCYYLGIDEVPQYVLPDGNEDKNEEKQPFKELPFDELPNREETRSIYGSLTCLSFVLDDTGINELKAAMKELLELGFVCEYEDVSDWGDEYRFKGILPGTETEMLISVYTYEEAATVLYLLKDGNYFKEDNMLAFYDIDYGFDILSELNYRLCYFLDGMRQYESDSDAQYCYRYTQKYYDTTSDALVDLVQNSFDEDDYRLCDVIEAGSYNGNGEFALEYTYVYLATEDELICFDANGNVIN